MVDATVGFFIADSPTVSGLPYDLQTFRGDILGGVTAAVVGLPVALAFGLAAGLGPAAGIYGAISVGFFAAVFGGTRSLISGPTGSMTVAMSVIVAHHADDISEAFTIVIMAGLIQIVFGLLRIGRYVTYTPYSVISGFMTGVGVIIILVQTLPFLGWTSRRAGQSVRSADFPEVFEHFEANALAIAAATLAVALLWPEKFEKRLPSILVALGWGRSWAPFGSPKHRSSAPCRRPAVLPLAETSPAMHSWTPLSRRWS